MNKLQNLSIFTSSKGASTSSNIQNGDGFSENSANTNDNAVNAFSPPDSKLIDVNFFPGGLANTATPVFKRSFSVIFRYAFPPLKSLGKISWSFLSTFSKVSLNLSFVSLSIFLIASSRELRAATKSSFCIDKYDFLSSYSLNWSIAARFIGPILSIADDNSASLFFHFVKS